MNKTKAIALSAVCSAMAIACFVGATYIDLFGFVLSLLGGVIVCVPMIVTPRYRTYTLLALTVSLTVTAIMATSRIVEMVYYCSTIVPIVVVKAWSDGITLDLWQEDDNGNAIKKPQQPRYTKTKWILYYVLMQISIVAVLGITYLMLPLDWADIIGSYIIYALVLLLELVPIVLDRLLNGIFPIVKKAMIKAKLTP